MSCTPENTNQEIDGELKEVYWDLNSLLTVEHVSVEGSVVDGDCLVVELNTTMVEPDVEEVLSLYDAQIKRPRINKDSNLCIEVIPSKYEPEEKFKKAGTNVMRKRGGSRMIAIPPEAAERADFEEDDEIEISSRSDEIRLSSD